MALSVIQNDVHQLTRQWGLSADLTLLERAWEVEIGTLGRFAKLCALEKTHLIIEATSSTAMQEIMLRRRELIRRINQHFRNPWIDRLTVRMANGR